MSVSNGPTEKHITKFLLPYSERIIKVDDVEDISSAKENLKELMDIYDQMGQRKEEEDEESRALGEAIERQKAEIEKLKERPAQTIADDLKAYFTKMLKNADFVQVVRCKDCKHSYIDIEGNRICNTDGYTGIIVKDNDYCSYGERRKDG